MEKPVHIAPLVVFRIVFGLMMFGAVVRFWNNGWIKSLYIDPDFSFPYLGLEWIKPLGSPGMYIAFSIMGISALMIAFGFLFRLSSFLFFLTFTYVELIDKTPYLNHYYFICLVSFLLFLTPANRFFSLDVRWGLVKQVTHVPQWIPGIIKLQLGMVYFFAGIAKLHPDWLFEALPLKIWLPARADMPVLGDLFAQEWVAYLFSWVGLIFDLIIPFVLLSSKWRWVGYMFVVIFHVLTWLLFNIGMFPFVMIGCTLIFFSEGFHLRIIHFLSKIFKSQISNFAPHKQPEHKDVALYQHTKNQNLKSQISNFKYENQFRYKLVKSFLLTYFIIQSLLPFRYLLYPGNLFWTEEGFRFSWRVMLMEKYGSATFYVCDGSRSECIEINNRDYLTSFQEKMMCTQPDMILQFAHFLRDKFKNKPVTIKGKTFHFKSPKVYVDSYVSLNGRGSRRFIDQSVNLAQVEQSLAHKTWVLPYTE